MLMSLHNVYHQKHCSSCELSAFIFLLQMEKQSVQTTYTENDHSMLRYIYDCVFFVARKPTDVHFNCQDDDQQHISPPAAKSPRREGTDSLT